MRELRAVAPRLEMQVVNVLFLEVLDVEQLAVDIDDSRFDVFEQASDADHLSIGIGAAVRTQEGVCIGLIHFPPEAARPVFCKMHLHSSEEPYYVAGTPAANPCTAHVAPCLYVSRWPARSPPWPC